MSLAILFPGQGSQYVGMGADLFERRPDLLGTRADQVLGWSLQEICLEGPEDALTRTEHAQPALYALSYALWACITDVLDDLPAAAAGHSLGEYTALAAAGAFTFEAGLGTVAQRGAAMAAAVELEPSGMAALIGADPAMAEHVAEVRQAMGGRLQVANVNAPGQVVMAGTLDDISWLTESGGDLGVRRVIPLKVAGAFHSSFMEPALTPLEAALELMATTVPGFPVWSNTTARPHTEGALKQTLLRQVVSPVRFSESLIDMARSGVDTFVHVGPGDVTAGMARKTVPDATVIVVSDTGGIDALVDAISTMGDR